MTLDFLSARPSPPTSLPSPTTRWRGRWPLVAVCACLAGLVLHQTLDRSAVQRQLGSLLDGAALGERQPTLERQLRRETEAAEAKLVLARALLASELGPGTERSGTPAAQSAAEQRGLARLELAAELARTALAERPASADARLVLGATNFLLRSRHRDTRLFSAYRDWETPLRAAERLAPASPEPDRLLAGAYLEVWPALSPAKRQQALDRLRLAFADRPTLERLLAPWLAVAGSIENAAPLLPDEPWIWQSLAAAEAQRQRWPEYLELQRRAQKAQHRALAARLDEAAARMRGGDAAGAAPIYLEVAASSRPEMAYVPLLERALEERPPGPVGESLDATAHAWLDWAFALCAIGDCPLSAAAFARLDTAASSLPPSQEALASLAAGDLSRAEHLERRAASQWSESWGAYLIAKARRLAALGQVAEAASTLATVHRNLQGELAFALARAAVSGSRPPTGGATNNPAIDLASPLLDPFRRTEWLATDWLWQGTSARLPLLPGRAAAGLTLHFDNPSANGSVVEVQWNGSALPPRIVDANHASLELELPIQETPALLQVQTLAGPRVRPTAVALLNRG